MPTRTTTAPAVRSLVTLVRDEWSIEIGPNGCYLVVLISALSDGVVEAYFLASEDRAAKGGAALPVLKAGQVSREHFSEGQRQTCRLFLCPNLERSLNNKEGTAKHHLVVEIRADSNDVDSVTVQRSYFKLQPGGSITLSQQFVQVGEVIRKQEVLYGTMTRGAAADAEGGECVICLTKRRDVVILNCRHVCLCRSCAAVTSSTWSFQCPVCRGRVEMMVGLEAS